MELYKIVKTYNSLVSVSAILKIDLLVQLDTFFKHFISWIASKFALFIS